MTEDEGEEGREAKQQRDSEASRPTTAAARRERRRAARRAEAGEGQHAKASGDGKRRPPRDGGATTEKKGRPTPSRDDAEKGEQKQPVHKRFARFLREVVAELRKVIWPTRKQMITYFTVVLVFVVVMTAFIYGLDYGLIQGMFTIFG